MPLLNRLGNCSTMPRLYLLGGENVFKRSAQKVNEQAFQDVEERPVVAVFPWARASFDNSYRKRKLLTNYFISLGAGLVDFIDYSDSRETIEQKLDESNLIYLTGGLVVALIERLRNMKVDDMLRSYQGVIVGRSAGALALCRRCVITGRWSKQVWLVDGLGLADITLKAHYKPRKDPVLQSLSKDEKIYAVPSESAIVYDNGVRSHIGKAYLFENGVRKRL